MFHTPKTLKEAAKYRYGRWAGNPNGNGYHFGHCAAEIWPQDGWIAYQCSRKNGFGPEKLYCKQHGKMITS